MVELCTIVVTLMMNVNGMGWKPITQYLTTKELDINVTALASLSRGDDPSVKIKDVKIMIDNSKPFDCVYGPPIRPKR